MKRIILSIIVILIISCTQTFSQSLFGIKGSMNVSSLSSGDAKSRLGFDAGVFYSTPISDSWHFQPGVSFSLSGSKASDKYSPDYSAYMYALETPILMSYRMGDEDISFNVDMGVFARYGLSGNYWYNSGEGRIEPDIFDHHKRFNVGPQIGFSIFANNLYMGCGFQFGLIKPWDGDRRGNYYNYNLSFGYLFRIY